VRGPTAAHRILVSLTAPLTPADGAWGFPRPLSATVKAPAPAPATVHVAFLTWTRFFAAFWSAVSPGLAAWPPAEATCSVTAASPAGVVASAALRLTSVPLT
jgi:hypothetical protein